MSSVAIMRTTLLTNLPFLDVNECCFALWFIRSTNSWCDGVQNSGITQICIITLWVSESNLSFYEFPRVKSLRMSFRDVLQIKVTSQCVLNAKRICLWSIQNSSVVFLCEFISYTVLAHVIKFVSLILSYFDQFSFHFYWLM